jgi:uncharacterized protein
MTEDRLVLDLYDSLLICHPSSVICHPSFAMATDHIRYDILAQAALRGVVRTVLADAAKKGLPGEHHFKITFNTLAPGVRLSDRMRARYPQEMTIVLQYQFWDLTVTEQGFEVGLSFGGMPERLSVPFEAVTAFYDPAVQFGFQFETIETAAAAAADATPRAPEKPTSAVTSLSEEEKKPESLPAPAAAPSAVQVGPAPDSDGGGQVVRLDRFRKK